MCKGPAVGQKQSLWASGGGTVLGADLMQDEDGQKQGPVHVGFVWPDLKCGCHPGRSHGGDLLRGGIPLLTLDSVWRQRDPCRGCPGRRAAAWTR